MTWGRWVVCLAGLWAVGARAVDSTESAKFDLGARTGFVIGNLVVNTPSTETTGEVDSATYTYGGVLLGVAANFDLARWLTFSVGLHFVLDHVRKQITRKALDITGGFHLLGGARRTIFETDDIMVMERDPFALTLLVRPAFQAYSAFNSKTGTSIDGSVLGVDFGLEYRMDVGQRSSISFAFLYSLLTFASGITQIIPGVMTFEAGWRLFL